MLHAHSILAIIELAFYVPTLLLAFFICHRHGYHRSSGWVYTVVLCVIRIAGAICELLEIDNQSEGLIKAMLIIDSIGLSPLLLATLGLLSRFVDFVNTHSTPVFTLKHFRLLQVFITVGLILSITGGSSTTTSPHGKPEIPTTSKVGVILSIIAYVGLALIYVLSFPRTSRIPPNERRVAFMVLIALPSILARLVYSFCTVFLHSQLFNVVTGSILVLVLMARGPEFFVVVVYVVLGFIVDRLGVGEQGPIVSRPWRNKKSTDKGSKRKRKHTIDQT